MPRGTLLSPGNQVQKIPHDIYRKKHRPRKDLFGTHRHSNNNQWRDMELSFHRNLPQSDHHSLSTGYTCKNSCSSSSPAHKCHCFGKRSFYCIVVYIHRLGRYTRKRKDNFYLSNFLHFDIAREMNIPPKFLTMENLLCLKKVRKQG